MIRLTFTKDMINGGENAMGNGDNGALGPAPAGQTMIESAEVGFFNLDGSPSDLDEPRAQPAIAMADGSRVTFACAFIVAGRDFGPTTQMSGIGEATHIATDFGQEQFGHAPVDTGNG